MQAAKQSGRRAEKIVFRIAVCSPDAVLRRRVERLCLEYYARRADACIIEQMDSAAALLRQHGEGAQYELYFIELTARHIAPI